MYYGLSLNVSNLSTNLYISTAANAIAEMPAFLLTALFLDRFGRKPLAVGTMWLSRGFCVAGSLFGRGFREDGVWDGRNIRYGCFVQSVDGVPRWG